MASFKESDCAALAESVKISISIDSLWRIVRSSAVTPIAATQSIAEIRILSSATITHPFHPKVHDRQTRSRCRANIGFDPHRAASTNKPFDRSEYRGSRIAPYPHPLKGLPYP